MSTTIRCNKCGEEIEITKAIQEDLEQKILKQTEAKHQFEISALKKGLQEELLKQEKVMAEEREALTKKARTEAIEKVRKEYDAKIASTKEEAEEQGKQNLELQKQIKDLFKELREERGAKEKLAVDFERKLMDEETKIKIKARKEAEEESNLKLAQKDKQLADLNNQLKETQRKLDQGSQQLQGEVLELQLEEEFRKEFLYDEIREVPKGVRGADLIQVVKTRTGMVCGTIVWELKNTKAWSPSWLAKLRDDKRSLKADLAVLVSSVLPPEVTTFAEVDGVWVCDIQLTMALAHALHSQLIEVAKVMAANEGKADKAELVYNYLLSNDFKQRLEVLVEYIRGRKEEIDKEKMYFNKKWEKEDKNIFRIVQTTAGIYGDLQGLVGNALPKISTLELESGD
jgi:hypothetical protein